ncbi:uracil-DNA glycosylase family protein [Acidovorax sp.]|uniref:uracil-DNA glycosylase family protein n=1 Tax=Acidovorax sp. TaxID=1872122 RepID=UPI002ACD7FAE|nr:uracil-DNA glycosylase family protein [Acidovorax sp.]MDZ7861527.1 uracil-DNA glycosylase family protein [Acidovorax sp.]
MSLSLDARQRAMLQEMGVTVWAPGEATAAPPAVASVAAPAARAVPAHDGAVATALRPAPQSPAPAAPQPAQAHAPAPAAPRATAASTPVPQAAVAAATGLSLHTPQALYPTADPARTPAGLGGGWLIVAEIPQPAEPLSGDAGKLLDNMLRAMQLHRHPRVFLAALQRIAPGGHGGDADVAGQLSEAVTVLQPAMVLVLGHVAARAALASTEPLGRLRAGPHTLAGCPAVVTYDPAFLLRSQDNKAAAWADLCRALATVRATTPAA